MTNKERAIEISNEFMEGSFKHGCYLGAMKMAEWKDQEVKEYLEKKKASIDNYAQAMMFSPFINEIINELFKED